MLTNKRTSVHLYPSVLHFSSFSAEDILKLSVAKIVTPLTYDKLGNPVPGGLYDSALGPGSTSSDQCGTCFKSFHQCPGHIGHTNLIMPVYNPIFKSTAYQILRVTCLECFKLQMSGHVREIIELQLQLLNAGYIIEAQEIEIYKGAQYSERTSDCGIDKKNKIIELRQLLADNPINNDTQTKESLRISIVNTTLKDMIKKKCIFCKSEIKRVKSSSGKIVIFISKTQMESFYKNRKNDDNSPNKRVSSTHKVVIADEARTFLRNCFKKDGTLLKTLFPILNRCSTNLECPVDIFFMDVVPITPANVRPINKQQHDAKLIINAQTQIYVDILTANIMLKSIISVMHHEDKLNDSIDATQMSYYNSAPGDSAEEKIFLAWNNLQEAVNMIMDVPKRNKQGQGIKQIIEKKEGIIRMHMMGKRVDYAARSVITPDPNINVDQIGVPELFAKKLSYPVPVTPRNVKELRIFVKNGPNIHPGANFIEYSNGKRIIIPGDNETKRNSLAKLLLTSLEDGVQIVHRHLLNDDILLLNRQPTLHRPSLQAHKARILKGEKTLRMHYSNCKAYNADFDGDEMNAHLPQNEVGRSEAYNLANVANNYLVPKDGTPLGGLIQDHMIAGVRLSMRGNFFNREDYQQLVFQGLAHIKGDIKLLPPSILKPIKLWSGKQIFSTLIINLIPKHLPRINLNSTAKIQSKEWQKNESRIFISGGTPLKNNEMTESEVIISEGELLVGVLDKMHYGSTSYSLIHSMYELYGGECSTQLLTSLTKCFTTYLQWEGFTLGVKDILVIPKADKKRKKIIEECRKVGCLTVAKVLDLPENVTPDVLSSKLNESYGKDPKFRTVLDRAYKSVLDGYTNEINKTCLPAGLLVQFPDNNLQLMVQSGAKGSTVNTMQISCLLGQIELEGKRPPLMISNRSLPSFPIFETSPKSGGFIDGRFMTGIQPQDFFFHCMAGREGLIDTAVKTSRSGYLQRCLIKHLEGLTVNYDLTVRDSDSSVIQFLYGEDGLDISQSQFLKPAQMPFLVANSKAIVNPKLLEQIKNPDKIEKKIRHQVKKLLKWYKKNSTLNSKLLHVSSFQQFSKEIKSEIEIKKPNKLNAMTGRRKIDEKIVRLWRKADEEKKEIYSKNYSKCPEPLVKDFRPDNNYGAVSEYLQALIRNYCATHKANRKEVESMVYVKNLKSLAAPGEPVGLLAAQSIGEPSTQMTLNTFHFAGRGEMNVTLGIPRLREILMMASKNIKTPSMDIPFKNIKNLDSVSEKLRLRLIRVSVADVLEKINVKSSLVLHPSRAKQYIIKFCFLPYDSYNEEFCVKPKQIIQYMTNTFFKLMFRGITKAAKEKHSLVDVTNEKPSKSGGGGNSNEDDDEILDTDQTEPTEKHTRNSNDEDSDDDEYEGDGDATDSKLKNKQTDECDYDEAEEDEAEVSDSENGDEIDETVIENQDDAFDVTEEDAEKVVGSNEFTKTYSFDKKSHLWCQITFNLSMIYRSVDMSTLLKQLCKTSVIWEAPNIKRAITYTQNDSLILKTDGININEMFKYNKILDLNRLYSNDIHEVGKTYGIEAARQVIVKEVQNVFNVYGITVDPRHLLLIADYMTFDGTYKSLNRTGMEACASPLQQISFESSLKFLKSAMIAGKGDNLNSPSSRLMLGVPLKSGTGSFDLLTDYQLVLKKFGKC